ncbi:MAG: hypothetical protein BWZ04_03144 [Firmicutes bacterium ADurb.BinA205]|nr:MAG: hypothetical protein BWZ04_03144 [Firmicutes bacterium ADurb.BinA205]
MYIVADKYAEIRRSARSCAAVISDYFCSLMKHLRNGLSGKYRFFVDVAVFLFFISVIVDKVYDSPALFIRNATIILRTEIQLFIVAVIDISAFFRHYFGEHIVYEVNDILGASEVSVEKYRLYRRIAFHGIWLGTFESSDKIAWVSQSETIYRLLHISHKEYVIAVKRLTVFVCSVVFRQQLEDEILFIVGILILVDHDDIIVF